jgi:hypothetical protein
MVIVCQFLIPRTMMTCIDVHRQVRTHKRIRAAIDAAASRPHTL